MATATTLSLIAPGMALLLAGPAAAAEASVERVPGQTRYDTAATAAAEAFGTAGTVVLVNGEAFPDAMSAAYLAGLHDAPILLTQPGSTPAATSKALTSLGAKKVILVGGEAAVSPAQAQALSATGLTVSRVQGADRFATAAAVAREGGKAAVHMDADGKRTAFVASGEVFADAMAAAPVAYAKQVPVLLTKGTTVSTETVEALRALEVQRVVVLGGSSAVSTEVAGQLDRLEGVEVDRVHGENRRATAVAIAEMAKADFGFGTTTVGLSNGASFADALAAAPLLGKAGAPILLTGSASDLGSETRGYLASKGGSVATAKVFGGDDSVASGVLTTIREVIASAPAPAPTTPPVTPQEPAPQQPAPDTTPPSAPVLEAETLSSGAKLVLTGTAEPGSTVQVMHGQTLLETAPVAQDGTFSVSVDLTGMLDGQHSFTVFAVDAAKPRSETGDVVVVDLDATAPALTELSTGLVTPTNETTFTLTGKAEQHATVTVSVGESFVSQPMTVTEVDGSFSIPVTLDGILDGVHTVTVSATDQRGNVHVDSGSTVVVDTTAPAAAGVEAPADGAVESDTVTFSGTAEEYGHVTVWNGSTPVGGGTADALGTFSFVVDLTGLKDEEITPLVVVVTDAAGNKGEDVVRYITRRVPAGSYADYTVVSHSVFNGEGKVTAYSSGGTVDGARTFIVTAGDAFVDAGDDGFPTSPDEFAARLTAGDTLSIDYHLSQDGSSVFHLTDHDQAVVELTAATYVEVIDSPAGYDASETLTLTLGTGDQVVDGTSILVFDVDGDSSTKSDQHSFSLHHSTSPATRDGDDLDYTVEGDLVHVTWPSGAVMSSSPTMVKLRKVADVNNHRDWSTEWRSVAPAV